MLLLSSTGRRKLNKMDIQTNRYGKDPADHHSFKIAVHYIEIKHDKMSFLNQEFVGTEDPNNNMEMPENIKKNKLQSFKILI